ncbi:MAG: hypothetical protein EG823_00340 [Actinobacteria bacterium]|nr:hypothetical protein [Actinomycetota bacterium]
MAVGTDPGTPDGVAQESESTVGPNEVPVSGVEPRIADDRSAVREASALGVGRAVAGMSFTQSAVLAVNFVITLVTAWALGASGRGVLTMATLGPALTSSLGVLGMAQSIAFYAASPSTDDGDVYAWTWISAAVLGAGWLALWLVLAPIASRTILQGVNATLLRIAALCIPADIAARLAASYSLGKGAVRVYNRVDLVTIVSRLAALVVALNILGQGVGGAVGAGVVASFVGATIAVAGMISVGHDSTARPTRMTLRGLVAYGRRVWVGSLAQQLNFRLDYFLVNYFAGTGAVGVYSVATRLAEVMLIVPRSLAKVWFVRVAQSGGEGVRGGRSRTTAMFRGILVSALLAAPLAMTAVWVLVPLVFGPEFAPARVPFMLLLPGVIVLSSVSSIEASLSGSSRPGAVSAAAAVAALVTIVLDLVLVPSLGITGAAIVSSVSYLCYALVCVATWRRITEVDLRDLLPQGGDFRSVLAAGARLVAQERTSSRV